MVQYQDLGLTLKATPKVLRDDAVALSLDMTLDSLSGQTIDGNPVLDNRAYSGVVTLKEGEQRWSPLRSTSPRALPSAERRV